MLMVKKYPRCGSFVQILEWPCFLICVISIKQKVCLTIWQPALWHLAFDWHTAQLVWDLVSITKFVVNSIVIEASGSSHWNKQYLPSITSISLISTNWLLIDNSTLSITEVVLQGALWKRNSWRKSQDRETTVSEIIVLYQARFKADVLVQSGNG